MIGLMPSFNPSGFSLEVRPSIIAALTSSTVNFGTATLGKAISKTVFLVIEWSAGGVSRAITSVSVGGSAATQVARYSSGYRMGVDIYKITTTLASAAISVTFNGSMNGGGTIGIYTAYGIVSGALYASAASTQVSSGSSLTTSVNTLAGSFILTGVAIDGSSGTSISLSNAIEDWDTGGSSEFIANGHNTYPGTTTGLAVGAAFGASRTYPVMLTAVIRK